MLLFFFSMLFYSIQNDSIVDFNKNHIYFLRNKKIDSVSIPLYDLKNSQVFLGVLNNSFVIVHKSTGDIHLYNKDSIKQFQNQDLKFRNHSQIFINNDTIYRYGGYGFNQTNNTFQFFDFDTKKWHYLKNNVEEIHIAPFHSNHLIVDERVYFLGGSTIDYKDGLRTIPHNITVFDLKTRKFINEKFSELNFLNYKVLGKNETGIYFFDNSLIYYLDINDFFYEIFSKPEKLTLITESNENRKIIDGKLLFWNKHENKISDIDINEITNDKNLVHYERINNDFEYKLQIFKSILLYIIILIIIYYVVKFIIKKNKFIIQKNKLIFNNNEVFLNKHENQVMRILISKTKITSKELLNIIYNENLSYGQNQRIKLEFIKDLNEKLKFIINSKNNVITMSKNKNDKREVIYQFKKK